MIGWLSGTIRQRFADRVLIDTGGVGYEVHATPQLLSSLGHLGTPVALYIHTHVREDALVLFGFSSLTEREIFLSLMTVSGVGAKTAMHILSALPPAQLIAAIRSKDTPLLQRTPGIGKKTAERLVVELADRLKDFPMSGDEKARMPLRPGTPAEEVVSALLNLGYRRPEAEAAVAGVELSKFSSFDTILKETLKTLAR